MSEKEIKHECKDTFTVTNFHCNECGFASHNVKHPDTARLDFIDRFRCEFEYYDGFVSLRIEGIFGVITTDLHNTKRAAVDDAMQRMEGKG